MEGGNCIRGKIIWSAAEGCGGGPISYSFLVHPKVSKLATAFVVQ